MRDSESLKFITRQSKINIPTRNATTISESCIKLLHNSFSETTALRSMAVSVFDLIKADEGVQATMFDDNEAKKFDNLDAALDKIRSKYGNNAIKRANLIERDFIFDKTEDEDFLPFKRS